MLETMFKGPGAALALLLCVPVLLVLISPEPVQGHEFTVYRMQQYNLQREKYGCRGVFVQGEARTVEEEVLTRRCVIMRLPDFTLERFHDAVRQTAAAMLILVPANISSVPQHVAQPFMASEPEALLSETLIPVYVAHEDSELLSIYEQTKSASLALRSSAVLQVISMVTANGFQMVAGSDVQIKPINDSAIVTLEGMLPGRGEDLPTIVIVAHYDSFGIAPWLSYGADSNGSGVAVLLELARLFHKLYSDRRTQAGHNILFSLTGGGKFNYQGTKRWIEEHLDHSESSLLHDNVAFVLCLDTLGNGEALHLHVSRPPRPGTVQHAFIQQIEQVVSSCFPSVTFGVVHKKINLGDTALGLMPGSMLVEMGTAGTHPLLWGPAIQETPHLPPRSQMDIRKLRRNTAIVAEALARFMYNFTEKGSLMELQVFKGRLEVQESRLSSLVHWLSSQSRAAQLLERDPGLLPTLELQLSRYLRQVQRHTFLTDKR
ncbi:nicalin-1-like isoform X2 [Huso huso]|uniref:BOS complex subunit NCLN n=1 Tax=Huso huso TaxID=61971 RepID=A0ABR1ACZ2_HUSHU